MYCSTCGDERLFEQPPCPDGHGAECPERACVECGAAVLVGLPPAVPGSGDAEGAASTAEHPSGPDTSPREPGPPATGRTSSERAVA